MPRYQCEILQQDDKAPDQFYQYILVVDSGGDWEMLGPKDFKPRGGRWDASDLQGKGGCVCLGAEKRPILKLDEFKPFASSNYGVGKVGRGTGRFLQPLSPVYKREFNWDIEEVT